MELEKHVSAITERLDMAENYNRHLNIRVVSLLEDTVTGQPVELTTKASRIKLESARRIRLNAQSCSSKGVGFLLGSGLGAETNRELWIWRAG